MLIYISYSSRDQKLAQSLADHLEKLGHAVRLESKKVGGTATWNEAFEDIRNAELFILALTPQSLRSYARRIEYSYAAALHKRTLAVMLSQVDLRLLPPELSETLVIDFQEQSELAIASLSKALAHLPTSASGGLMPPLPNVNTTLASLREQIDLLPPQYTAQNVIMLNLQEFLERGETAEEARVLLNRLAAHEAAEPEITDHIKRILGGTSTGQSTNGAIRHVIRRIGELTAVVVVALLILLLARSLLSTRPVNSSTPTAVAAVAIADTSTATNTPDIQGTFGALLTQTALAAPSLTPTPTAVPATVITTPQPTEIAGSTDAPTAPPTVAPSFTPVLTSTSSPLPPTVGSVILVITATPLPTFTPGPSVTPSPAPTLTSPFRPQIFIGISVQDTAQGIKIIETRQSAKIAGARIGDYILDVDLQPVADRADFLQRMAAYHPLSQVVIRLRRNGQFVIARINLTVQDFAIATATSGS